jgi:serine/threonine protein kinase/predicted ATPase
MTPEVWRRIDELVQAALDLPPEDRAAFVDSQCGGDAGLRRVVASLMSHESNVSGSLESLAIDDAAASIEEGRTIDHYRVIRKIGQGGMGSVYLAEDTRLGRKVAIKVLLKDDTRNEDLVRRFTQEAKAASALNHPNIITIYEIGEADSSQYIVTEYIEGETLRENRGQMSVDAVVDVCAQIAGALMAAHAAGIVHRDIKPENVMLRRDGYVKVLDFGLAKLTEGPSHEIDNEAATQVKTEIGAILGTVNYMSPEQVRGQAVDARSDIFSLGVVLYEMITGRSPFLGPTTSDTMAAILLNEPAPLAQHLRGVPPGLERVVRRALAKDREERYQAISEFYSDLKQEQRAFERQLEPAHPSAESPGGGLDGKIASSASAGASTTAPYISRPIVGRERERAELRSAFESAAGGRGLFVCVSGESGMGKTTLVEDFLAGISAGPAMCHVARGRSSERLAGTEAYLPFIEALESLLNAPAGESVARLLKTVAPTWYVQLSYTSDSALLSSSGDVRVPSQERMKRELAAFFRELSRSKPLIVFFDDLQWADVSTIDMLAYLALRFETMGTSIVATYRASDMLLTGHPFLSVKLDLQARGVCHEINLGFLTPEDIDQYLGMRFPDHRFPPGFSSLVHSKTEGSPLFTVDVLSYLCDRKVIARVRSEGGSCWALAQPVPDIERELPESVRSLIQRKIDRLDGGDRRLLSAASVQGYEFDSATLARALDEDPTEIEERLEALDRVHAFVGLAGEELFPDRTLTQRYRFIHILYQNAFYALLRPTRKASLSLAVADALLSFYGKHANTIASELAHLFETARDSGRAAEYFLLAAQNAAHVPAPAEAAVLARRGLDQLVGLPDRLERARCEISLEVILGQSLLTKGPGAPEVEESLTRARELCQRAGETTQLSQVIWVLWSIYAVTGKMELARQSAQDLLRLAQSGQDPALSLGAHYALGFTLRQCGELVEGRDHVEAAISLHEPQKVPSYISMFRWNPGAYAISEAIMVMWLLGYPEQARRRAEEAIALATRTSDASSLVHAQLSAAILRQFVREPEELQRLADERAVLCDRYDYALERMWIMPLRGWITVQQGLVEEGTAQIRQSIEALRSIGAEAGIEYFLSLLAEGLWKDRRCDEGFAAVSEAENLVHRSGRRWWEAELYRLEGELLLAQTPGQNMPSHAREAEERFGLAIEIARNQSARSLELRATLSLSRLYEGQGRRREAREKLAAIYGWFTEGFDTADLKEAKSLLDNLA